MDWDSEEEETEEESDEGTELVDENRFEIEDDETVMYSEAALKVGFCKLSWMGGYLAVFVALFWCLYLFTRFYFLWRVNVYSRVAAERSSLEASFLVGTEVGLLAMAVLLAFLIPRMIMTWTTALVFDFMFGRAHGSQEVLVEDGSKMAVELSIRTLKRVVSEGNRVAFIVGIACLLLGVFSKHTIDVENEMLKKT